MEVNIDVILEDLKEGKTNKTQQSLDRLNETLRVYYECGERDFSITTIGRLSAQDGGVGYESIRATANKHYRDLIEAWAAKAKTTTKKPLSSHSRSRRVPQDNQLLERLPDPAMPGVRDLTRQWTHVAICTARHHETYSCGCRLGESSTTHARQSVGLAASLVRSRILCPSALTSTALTSPQRDDDKPSSASTSVMLTMPVLAVQTKARTGREAPSLVVT